MLHLTSARLAVRATVAVVLFAASLLVTPLGRHLAHPDLALAYGCGDQLGDSATVAIPGGTETTSIWFNSCYRTMYVEALGSAGTSNAHAWLYQGTPGSSSSPVASASSSGSYAATSPHSASCNTNYWGNGTANGAGTSTQAVYFSC